MKIAIITSRYPTNSLPYNHMFVHMRSLEFKKNGYQVSVFVPSNKSLEYVYEGILVNTLPNTEIVNKLHQFDIAYLHLLNLYAFKKTNGWPIYKYIVNNNMPYAMYGHGSCFQKFIWGHQFDNKLIDFARWFQKDFYMIPRIKKFVKSTQNRKNSSLIFPSNWIKKEAERNLKLTINNFHIIPNGIDTNLFTFKNLQENRFKLLCLRPFSKKYAVDIAIETMRFLPKKYSLEIYGKGSYEKKYKKMISNYQLENVITIENKFLHRTELDDFFSNFGVFLAPSRMDTQGLIVCEAMASGLLIVSSNNTGIPEFVNKNITGILENSPKELAKKIIEITENIEAYKIMTLAGRKSMEDIKIKKIMKKEFIVLEELVKKS